MRIKASIVAASAVFAFSTFVGVDNALADQVTIVGPVTKIQLAPDGKSATAMLKDNKTGELIVIQVTDDLTLDKFKDKRIVEGDEIRTKFDKDGAKNVCSTRWHDILLLDRPATLAIPDICD